MTDQNRTYQNGRVSTHSDVQCRSANRKTSFSGRGNACIKLPFSGHIANKFRRPTILQLNIEWTNHKWKTEYCENASRLRVFVPGTGARPVGMDLPRAACGLVLGDSIRPCTNGVSLLHQIASVAPLSKPQTMF